MTAEDAPVRILFVFAWLVVGGEETEVRLLAEHMDRSRYRIDVVACFRKPGMTNQTHEQLRSLGVDVDTAPYDLSLEDTISYLAGKIPGYDVVVSCQNVADIYPALERLHLRPPLIEHGGLVSEALAGPKHLTSRYVGVCRSIRDAAASRMPGLEHNALEIPSMVDLADYDPATPCFPFWAIAKTFLTCCPRSTFSSGCRAAKACRMSLRKPVQQHFRSLRRPTTAPCNRSTMVSLAYSFLIAIRRPLLSP
jgi:hypothetical protein